MKYLHTMDFDACLGTRIDISINFASVATFECNRASEGTLITMNSGRRIASTHSYETVKKTVDALTKP